MVARSGRTPNPSLDRVRWSHGTEAHASRFWQSGHRTNDRTIKRKSTFRLASRRTQLRNYPLHVKSAAKPSATSGGSKSRSAAASCLSRGVLSFLSKARETSGSETARVHHAARRRGGVAASGARAAGRAATDRRFVWRLAKRSACTVLVSQRFRMRLRSLDGGKAAISVSNFAGVPVMPIGLGP